MATDDEAMVDDDTIYRDFSREKLSTKDCEIISKILTAWADSMEKLPENEKSLRLVFAACINTIGTMGPAYCRIAATTLLHHADIQDEEDEI
jgi:hypothetical protein